MVELNGLNEWVNFLLKLKSAAYLEGFGVEFNFLLTHPLIYLAKIWIWVLDFWMQLTRENIEMTSAKNFVNVWSKIIHSNILLHVSRS